MTTPRFHPLTVREVRPETDDAVSVAFDVPAELREDYRFKQGQFLTLKAMIDGEELRRAYSICIGVPDYEKRGELRIGIKRVPGGKFSNFANDTLRTGQSLEVMTPDGRFNTALDPAQAKHYVGFAGGSGITPMLALIKTTLSIEDNSQFTLVYGNRSMRSIMFAEDLEDLKNVYLSRLTLIHVLSDEPQEAELLGGLLDEAKCRKLLDSLIPVDSIDEAFICGPGPMMDAAEAALKAAGVQDKHIHIERFGSFAPAVRQAEVNDDTPAAELTIIFDGKERRTRVAYATESGAADTVLEAGLRTGAALPYSCKGGNCCTCRAKVLEGTVKMMKNFALTQDEVDQGFVLSCQCIPLSEKIVVSFDER